MKKQSDSKLNKNRACKTFFVVYKLMIIRSDFTNQLGEIRSNKIHNDPGSDAFCGCNHTTFLSH